MDFLQTHVFTSFLISCIYFIVKTFLNKFNVEDKDNYEFVRKNLFKDCVILFILTYLLLIFKEQMFKVMETKTQVFTNEPSF